ncbi:MAG: hemerythrin-like domain-containing protein [Reinekea sp.]
MSSRCLMGTALLQKLNNDHKDIARILYCFRTQIRGYEDPESTPNTSQIMNILDYITYVPERWHHPIEDLIFTRLLERSPPHPQQIKAVLREHEDLERLTEELKAAFDQVAMDITVPVAHLYRTATIYLSRQLLHLDAEETVIFPMAEELLTEDDWNELDELAEEALESFDESTKIEYDKLRDDILNFEENPYQQGD